MIRRTTRSTRTDTLLPSKTIFRSPETAALALLFLHIASPSPRLLPRLQPGDLAPTGALAQQRNQLSHQRLLLPSAHLPAQLQRHQQFGQRLAVEDSSEEHTSELQSLMRISYPVFCLKKTKPP